MAGIDLISTIETNYSLLTKAEKRIADYIMKKPGDVLYMSITDLADACGVGDTSVFRFCRTLKLQGYQEFKLTLAQSIHAENNVEGVELSTGKITLEDDIGEVAQKVLSANIAALNDTYQFNNAREVSLAVDFMMGAKKIAFFGVGSSWLTAMKGASKFMGITGKAICTFDSHLQTMTAALLTEQDLAIIISYSGSTRDTVEIAKILKDNGVRVVSITRFVKSPLTVHSDLTLLSGANEGPLQSGSISAKISQLYLLDILYTEYYKRTYRLSTKNRKNTSSALIDKLY